MFNIIQKRVEWYLVTYVTNQFENDVITYQTLQLVINIKIPYLPNGIFFFNFMFYFLISMNCRSVCYNLEIRIIIV